MLTLKALAEIEARETAHQYWLSIGGSMDADAPKDRTALLAEVKRLRDALVTIADPANKANFRTQVFAKSIIDPELTPLT